MAIEKVGVYRKWLEPVPKDNDGKLIPKSHWIKRRLHHWIVRWYGTNSKKYGKVFRTKKEAEGYARKLQNQVLLGRADKPQKITLHEFRLEHEHVMQGQVAYATLVDQKRALRFFENFIGGSFPLSKIKPRHAEAFIAHRLSTVPSVATVNKDIRTLRRIFNLAIEPRGYLMEGQNPFARIKQRKKTEKPIRYMTTEEYHRLMDAAGDNWWKAFISLAYGSGLRRNEILNLTWAEIDFEKQLVQVKAKDGIAETIEWEPKDHENRVVPMSDETAQLLAAIQSEVQAGHPYIFISPERLKAIKQRRADGKWNPRSEIVNNLAMNFDAIRVRAGVPRCSVHDLRRSAITNWAQKLPMQVVQTFAGHSNMLTTRKYYLAVRPEDLVSANQLLNTILARNVCD
jgi:integrase